MEIRDAGTGIEWMRVWLWEICGWLNRLGNRSF